MRCPVCKRRNPDALCEPCIMRDRYRTTPEPEPRTDRDPIARMLYHRDRVAVSSNARRTNTTR